MADPTNQVTSNYVMFTMDQDIIQSMENNSMILYQLN